MKRIPPPLPAVLGAAVAASAFPPFGFVPGAVIGPALLFAAVRLSRSRRAAFLVGALYGAAFFGSLMWWLVNLQVEALVALMVAQSVFYGAMAAIAHLWKAATGWTWVLPATAAWTAMEFVRARVPFGGMEWGAIGYPVGEWGAMRSAAQWIGVSGWGVMVAALAAALAVGRRGTRLGAVLLGAVAVLAIAGGLSPIRSEGPVLRTAIVQGNSPCPEHCPGERQAIFASHLELTRGLEPGRFDLVVWPESASTFPLDSEDAAVVAAEARRLGATMLVGGDRPDSDTSFINSIAVFTPEGELATEIRKRHPVPFGEYVPVRSVFGRLAITSQVPRDMVRGDGPVVVSVGDVPTGAVISFEGAFSRYARDVVVEGAQVLVVASNEASYGVSPASDQFIGMTRMRSAELGVDVVHGAITGSSTFVTDGGRVGDRTGLYVAEVLTGEVQAFEGRTLFASWGDWLAVALMVAGAMALTHRLLAGAVPRG